MDSNRREHEERKRVIDEGKGRYKRQRSVGHMAVIGDYPGEGVAIGPDPILCGRVTLDIVMDFIN